MIDVTKISSVYSGRDGKCCCGCSGKYSYASAHRQAASAARGYEVGDDEVNDRNVSRVVNIFNAADPNAVEFDGEQYCLVDGNRLYMAQEAR